MDGRVRPACSFVWIDQIWRDIRFACRSLRKQLGFSVPALLSLTLGIGANTAVFSVVNTVLLEPIPAPDAARVVVLATGFPEGPSYLTSDQKFSVWRQQS